MKPTPRTSLTFAILIVTLALAVGSLVAQQPVNVARISGSVPAYDPCLDPSKVVPFASALGAGTGATEHVAISGTTRIYLCSGKVQGGSAGTITTRFGTGTACASFPTDIDVTAIVTNGDGGLITNGGAGTYLRSATGQALCTVRSATMTAHINFRYVQE